MHRVEWFQMIMVYFAKKKKRMQFKIFYDVIFEHEK